MFNPHHRVPRLIASLRDPMGRPHVTLVIENNEVTEAYGRACSKPKPMLLERVEAFERKVREVLAGV